MEINIILLWTFAVSLSGVISVLICDVTLQRKYSRAITILGLLGAYLLGTITTFICYYFNISNDFGGVVGMSVIIWLICFLLYTEHWSSKLFVAIMATLIANVSTFFICGPTLSFIDNAPNPYNVKTIMTFALLKVTLFTLLFIIYKVKLKNTVRKVIEALDGKMSGYLPVAFVCFFGFYGINLITSIMGIIPAAITKNHLADVISLPEDFEIRYIFIAIYGIISLIFIFEFRQIFTSVFWTSRALKTEAELNIASKIQQDMLPCIFPAFPDRAQFDIYASMQPAKEVGGDFYDFFLVDDDTLVIVMADVSGKGVPAALFMVIAKTLLKNNAQYGKSPKEVFETVNNLLCENNEAAMFVTAFMGYLDIPTGRFTFVNAGHNPPLIRSGEKFDWLNAKAGFVLAGMEDMFYKQHEITLQPGDELFLYTDGVTEAVNNEKSLFGDPHLLETVNANLNLPLKEFTVSIKREIDKFAEGAEQADDITMLALRYKGMEVN